MNALLTYDWPGNVRELRTAIEHGVVMATGPKITVRDLPSARASGGRRRSAAGISPAKAFGEKSSPLDLHETERKLILQALATTNGNVTAAAKKLGISRRTLHRKINEMNAEKAKADCRQSSDAKDIKCPVAQISFNAQSTRSKRAAPRVGQARCWSRSCIIAIAVFYFVSIPRPRDFAGDGSGADRPRIAQRSTAGDTKFARPRAVGQLQGTRKERRAKNLGRYLQRAAAAVGRCDRAVAGKAALENWPPHDLFTPATKRLR